MNKNETLVRNLCLPYCCYYKKGKNEDFRCRGAVVVERLMRSGRLFILEDENRNNLDPAVTEVTVHLLCSHCDFREEDCDFAHNRNAQPCGGFFYLARLLGTGKITEQDIKE